MPVHTGLSLKAAVRIDEQWNRGRRRGAVALQQGEVQPDAEARGIARERHRFLHGGAAHHQTRLG
jgi:hypothetical protein